MLLFGLASQGGMMYAVTALYCAGLGLLSGSSGAHVAVRAAH